MCVCVVVLGTASIALHLAPTRLKDMQDKWQYDGDATCAADGMCAVRCPVNINTGEFTKQLRTAVIEGLDAAAGAASASTSSSWGSKLALFAANHFKLISRGAPALLNTVDLFHGLLGPRVLEVVSGSLNKWTNHVVPRWNPYIPKVCVCDVLEAHDGSWLLCPQTSAQAAAKMDVLMFITVLS